jgi:hypothetical protein
VRYSACAGQQLSPPREGHRVRKGRIRSSRLLRRRCARLGRTLHTIHPDSFLQVTSLSSSSRTATNLIPPMLNTNSRGRRRCVSNLEFQFGRFELTVYALDRRQANDHVYCRSIRRSRSVQPGEGLQIRQPRSGSHTLEALHPRPLGNALVAGVSDDSSEA